MALILIAEDDPTTQELMTKVITKKGHTVFNSPHGKHAYETLVSNDGFDLLITDIMMPEMDGRELIASVRRHDMYGDIPIIIMSAYVGVKEIANLLETGATVFQPKPLDMVLLENNIEKCLKYRIRHNNQIAERQLNP